MNFPLALLFCECKKITKTRLIIPTNRKLIYVQSNLDYPDLDYPDFSIIRTFSLVPFFSWILISFDLKSFQR